MDSNLVRSFYNIAKHYLTRNVRIIIEQHAYSFVQETIQKEVEKVQKELIVTQRQQTLLSVTAIQNYCETSIKSIFPQLKNSRLIKIVKNCVKQVIRSIIEEELNSKYAQFGQKRQRFQYKQNYLQELNLQKQRFLQNEAKNQSIRFKVTNEEKLKKGPLDCLRNQESNAMQLQKANILVYQKLNQYNQTRVSLFKQQHLQNQISNCHKKQNRIHERDINDQISIYGHFLYHDKPDEILDIFPVIDQIFVLISWKPREDEFLPQPSTLSVQTVRIFAPLLLTQYYQIFLGEQKNIHALQDIKEEQIEIYL